MSQACQWPTWTLGIMPCSCFLVLHWSNKWKRKFSLKITSMLRPCWDCVPVMSKTFINKKIKKSPDTTQTCGQLCPRSVCDQHRHFGHFAVFVLPSAPSSLKIITICRKIVKENIDLLQRQGFQKTEKIKNFSVQILYWPIRCKWEVETECGSQFSIIDMRGMQLQ